MHFIHPLVLKIGIPVLVAAIIALHVIKRKIKYRGGTKAANTKFIKELGIYKSRKAMYTIVSIVMEVCLITSMVASLVLIARPSKKETVNNGTKKRDIFLCMDVSYSIYELNEELVAEEREDLRFVWEAVKGLPDTQREVIHLFYQEGYKTAEIAEILGRKEATIRSDLKRARERLKEILKEEFDFG